MLYRQAETKDADGNLTAGLRFHAMEMIASGHWQISDLAGRYIKESTRESTASFRRPGRKPSGCCPSRCAATYAKNGVDLGAAGRETDHGVCDRAGGIS